MTEAQKKGETTVRITDPIATTASKLVEQLAPACHRVEIAGAIRRRQRLAPCVDLVVIPKIEPAGAGVQAHNYLWEVLDYFYADGGYSRRGDLIRSFRRPLAGAEGEIPVNVYSTTADSWGFEMAYRTGPGGFWFNVHTKLNIAGYTTRDGKVWRISTGAAVEVPEEGYLFALAGMLMREPWQRGATAGEERAW